MPKLASWLDIPIDPVWLRGSDYSDTVAGALSHAYHALSHRAFGTARARLERCERTRMSLRQLARIRYVQSMAHVREGNLLAALASLDEALDVALPLADPAPCAELAYLRASVNSERWQYAEAASDYRFCLSMLRAASNPLQPADPSLELEVVVELATLEFMLGHYDRCQRHLRAAQRLTSLAPHPTMQAAIEWIQMLLERWRGNARNALGQALALSVTYRDLGRAISSARLDTAVADIALDLIDSFPAATPSPARDDLLALAEKSADRASIALDQAKDLPGKGLALLAVARYDCMRGRQRRSLDTIENVEKLARQLHDDTLLGQAQTARGHALAAGGQLAASTNWYYQAIETFKADDAHAMCVWPQRALLVAQEMRP